MVSALDMRAYLKANVSSELAYLWDDQEVPLTLQFEVGQLYKSVKLFASMADTRAEVRGMASDFSLDTASAIPAVRSDARSQMAMLVACWESAREFTSKEATLRAEAKVLQVTRPVGQLERTAMKKAVEAIYGKMAPKVTPDADYLSTKLEEVEQDEPRASSLDEVLSIEDCQALSLSSSLDATGHVKITKTKVKGKLPSTTEGLRQKLRLEGNTWLMIASKCRHKR